MKDEQENLDLEFQLTQYLDGLLDDKQAAQLERKLARDPALARELELYRSLGRKLTGMSSRELEGADYRSLRSGVMASLERKALMEAAPRRVVRLWPALSAVAATLIVAVMAWLVFSLKPVGRLPQEVIQAQALPAHQGPGGRAEIVVNYRQMPPEAVRIKPSSRQVDLAGMPAGTVFISVGPEKGGYNNASSMDPLDSL